MPDECDGCHQKQVRGKRNTAGGAGGSAVTRRIRSSRDGPLRVRSYFSLLRGTASPAALCRRARKCGYQSLALTDIDNLYGLWEFLAACRKEHIRPIVGAEIGADVFGAPLVCLVIDHRGYKNLCRLISRKKCREERLTLEKSVCEGPYPVNR